MKSITRFFLNLISGGGIYEDSGVIYVWGDPNIMFSVDGFCAMQHITEKELGKEGLRLIYWIGKVNGKTASEVLIKRFGLSIDHIEEFANGATQDGFAHYRLIDKSRIPHEFTVAGTNCIFPRTYAKMFGYQKNPVCHYVCGMIAGGSIPLFNRDMECVETRCAAQKGVEETIIIGRETKKPEEFSILKKARIDTGIMLKKSTEKYFKTAGTFRILPKRNIKVGDGSFSCNGVNGIIISQRIVIILFEVLKKILGKKFSKVIDAIAEKNIDAVYEPKIKFRLFRENINSILNLLSSFGLGKFEVYSIGKDNLKIINRSSTFPDYYRTIAGKQEKPVCLLSEKILEKIFARYSGCETKAKEIKCKALRNQFCIFEIKILKKSR